MSTLTYRAATLADIPALVTRNDLMKALQGPAPHEMPVSDLVRRDALSSGIHDAEHPKSPGITELRRAAVPAAPSPSCDGGA